MSTWHVGENELHIILISSIPSRLLQDFVMQISKMNNNRLFTVSFISPAKNWEQENSSSSLSSPFFFILSVLL